MKSVLQINFFLIIIFSLLSCSIYRSSDRNEFENDKPQFQMQIQSLREISCSPKSIVSNEHTLDSNAQNNLSAPTAFKKTFIQEIQPGEILWQYQNANETIYESSSLVQSLDIDNPVQNYCIYEVTFEK